MSLLNNEYRKILKQALSGKLKKQDIGKLYGLVSKELLGEIQELPKNKQSKYLKDLGSFDDELYEEIKENSKISSNDLTKETTKQINSIKNEIYEDKKELKIIEKSNNITLNTLLKSTLELNDIRKQRIETKGISNLKLDYDRISEKLNISSKVGSISKSNVEYIVTLSFYELSDIKYSEYITIKETKIQKPNRNKNGVSVSCTCEDYMYTFSNANYLKNCHYGKLPNSFKEKSKVRNPKHLIGLCRHSIAFIKYLLDKNILD